MNLLTSNRERVLPIGRSQTCTKSSVVELGSVVSSSRHRPENHAISSNPDLVNDSPSANLASIYTSEYFNITNNTDIRQNACAETGRCQMSTQPPNACSPISKRLTQDDDAQTLEDMD
jgi:hypothetical protein